MGNAISRHCSQLILVVLHFFAEKSKINICLLSTFSECPAPWADMLALGQTKKKRHRKFQPSDVTSIVPNNLNYDIDDSIG